MYARPLPHTLRHLLLLPLALLGSTAWACELTQVETPLGSQWRTECSLSDLLPDLQGDLTIDANGIDTGLILPDLNPINTRFQVFDTEVDILLEVENQGLTWSPAFTVLAMFNVFDLRNPADPDDDVPVAAPQTVTISSGQSLTAQARTTLYVDTVNLPNRSIDYRIEAHVMVDPTANNKPLGDILELREGNNNRTENDIIYRR